MEKRERERCINWLITSIIRRECWRNTDTMFETRATSSKLMRASNSVTRVNKSFELMSLLEYTYEH